MTAVDPMEETLAALRAWMRLRFGARDGSLVERETTYGRTGDDFHKIVETRRIEGDTLFVERTVTARGYAGAFKVDVKFKGAP